MPSRSEFTGDGTRRENVSLFSELKRRNVLRVGAAYVVTAWLIIQVVETIFPIYGFSNAAIRLVISALAIGAIPVLFISWAFELTPEGLMRDEDVDRSKSIAADTGKKLDRLIIVVLALGLGYFAFDKFVLSESREAAIAEAAREEGRAAAVLGAYGDRSIAVLPFIDMSPAQDQAYMSDGIAEELLNLLAQVRELRVISRSSSFSFKGESVDIPTVSEKLNATYVLEGSVRLAGDQLRITAQLIDGRTDTHVWSSNYDRKLANIFEIQDDIAAAVVDELKITLAATTRLQSIPIDEETYQNGAPGTLSLVSPLGRETQQRVLEMYQEIVERGADLCTSLGGIIRCVCRQAQRVSILIVTKAYAWLTRLRYAQLRSIPYLANAHVRLGQAYARAGHMPGRIAAYERAYELDPQNPLVLGIFAQMKVMPETLDEAIEWYERAEAVDPVGAIWPTNKSEALLFAGRLDESEAAMERAYELNGNALFYQRRLMDISTLREDYERALEIAAAWPEDGYILLQGAVALYHDGRKAEAEAALDRSYEMAQSHPVGRIYARMGNAMYYARTDRFDEAFAWLEQARKDNIYRRGLLLNPFLKPLHDDPRWSPLVESYKSRAY